MFFLNQKKKKHLHSPSSKGGTYYFLFNIVDVCLRDGTSGSHIKGEPHGRLTCGTHPICESSEYC